MGEKNYTEVNLLGKTYNLGGYEDEAYLQRVATYVNSKSAELKKTQGYLRQPTDFRQVLLALNLADDYFKAQNRIAALEAKQELLEREIYELKHELVSRQINYENN